MKAILWFIKSFEKDGNPDAAKITAFLSFCVIVFLAGIDQFTKYKINEMVFLTFATIATAGLGISAMFKR
jgi:hypothetical protein